MIPMKTGSLRGFPVGPSYMYSFPEYESPAF